MLRERIVKVMPEIQVGGHREHNPSDEANGYRCRCIKTYRDITLVDILRILGKGRNELMSASTQGNGAFFVVKIGDGHMVWHLISPLHEQSDELGSWLLTIIPAQDEGDVK